MTKKVVVLVAVIAFAVTPCIVQADYQISPNPNYGTILVNAYNREYFDNYGSISIQDYFFTNFGTLNNHEGAQPSQHRRRSGKLSWGHAEQ